jgi:glycosyltransferase involved in cell wall biosynthesis
MSDPNKMDASLSVIIPAYNEEKSIAPVLSKLTQVLAAYDGPHEIIVVDDGSQDATAAVAETHTGVTVLRHHANRGYGMALKTGLRHAQHNMVCITDADGTYPNERIPHLVDRLTQSEFDMVVGARTGEKVSIPFIRRPAKWFIGQLANYVAGEHIPDLNSGLRVFRREVALQLFNMLPDGFSFTTTITLAMLVNGYLVDYVPINYYVRVGQSKIKPVRDTLNFIQLIMRMALYFAPLKIFLPLSGLLLLLALAWGLFSAFVLGRLADVSTLVITMTAIQIAIVGLLAELINQRFPNNYHNRK